MDLAELSDRAEITEVIVRYTRALDERRWEDLDALFTPDARIDYSVFDGPSGDVESTKKFLADSMAVFAHTQHMLGLPAIDLDGDRARAVTACHNPMLLGAGERSKVMVCSLWYHHDLVRTAGGWRIARLWEERNFMTILQSGDVRLT